MRPIDGPIDAKELNGSMSSPDEEPEALSAPSFHAAPPRVAELASACVRFVLAKYGVVLDGMPDTLSIVDQYVRDARTELLVQPEGLPLLAATVGAYFGEVVRGAFESSWRIEDEHDAWRLEMESVYLTFNPIGMAHEALTLADAEGWHAHFEMDEAEREDVERRLAALPEVSDDEYYALSTRFDVVEIAVDALRAKMIASGLGGVRFTRLDYGNKP
jgi:hypothetical protein